MATPIITYLLQYLNGKDTSFVEVSFHAVLKPCSHEQIALSATFCHFQNAPLHPPSASPMPLYLLPIWACSTPTKTGGPGC